VEDLGTEALEISALSENDSHIGSKTVLRCDSLKFHFSKAYLSEIFQRIDSP
jgi:hypothetical protein